MTNPEIERCKKEKQSLFEQKQAQDRHYEDLKKQTTAARIAMDAAWDERVSARKRMNEEFKARKAQFESRDGVWEEYGRIRDRNNAQIGFLKQESNAEHQAMHDCFERAHEAYEEGNRAEAPLISQEGYEHQARRDEINAKIAELAREVKQAKERAQAMSPEIDHTAFNVAKADFEAAKERHEEAKEEYLRLKKESNSAKDEFNVLQEKFKKAESEYQCKLKVVKTLGEDDRRQVIHKVNMALVKSNAHYLGTLFGQSAKIVPHSDGTTHVFFGGLNSAGDGLGHGHAVIDCDGNVTYLRDAWQKHDEYLIDNAKRRAANTHNI